MSEILILFKNNLSTLYGFIINNLTNIAIALVGIIVFIFSVRLTLSSLKNLKVEFFSRYPFDKFFPESGKWSAKYFIIVILFLLLIAFFILKGSFYFSPA